MHASMCGAACALAVVVLLPLTAVGALYADIQADRSTMADGGATIVTGGHSYSIATKHDMGENVLIGVLAWGGLWLRDARIRQILPIRLRRTQPSDRARITPPR